MSSPAEEEKVGDGENDILDMENQPVMQFS